MTQISKKAKIEQLCLFFAMNNATEIDQNVLITDEDLLFLMSVLNMQRYSIERSWKPVPNEFLWWNKALTDSNFNEDVFKCHFRMHREPFWKLCELISGR